jgi:hypothetical protein
MYIMIMYSDFAHERISYAGIHKTKKDILKAIPLLSYADLTNKPKKYKTVKSLFQCIMIPKEKKRCFNTYHLTKVEP